MTSPIKIDILAYQVALVMQDVLVHQRARWAGLVTCQHQFEGWWKAELLQALQSFCWRQDLPDYFWVVPEAKPASFGRASDGGAVADLMVGTWDKEHSNFAEDGVNVWIEIKERGTWWRNPAKALSGLLNDLRKWEALEWRDGKDVVLACLILTHRTTEADREEPLPRAWSDVLDHVGEDFVEVGRRSVGHCTGDQSGTTWATIVIFQAFPGRAPDGPPADA